MRFNPCCCCSAEAGIFVLLFFNLLYIAALIVLSVTYSSWTLSTVIYEPDYESHGLSSSSSSKFHSFLRKNSREYKIVIMIIWIAFLVYFAMEILLGLYLLKAINTDSNDTGAKCRRWVKTRSILLLSIIPFVVLHSYLHYQIWVIIVLTGVTLYHIYYLFLVQYYAHEIEVELDASRMSNSVNCRVRRSYTQASKRPLIIHCDKV